MFMSSQANYMEKLARMIFVEEDVDKDNGVVFGSAFSPSSNKKANRLETSVIIHPESRVDEEMLKVASYISSTRKTHPQCLGRADVCANDVRGVTPLDVEPNKSKVSDYHANIIGWNNDEAENLLKADSIAEKAVFIGLSSFAVNPV